MTARNDRPNQQRSAVVNRHAFSALSLSPPSAPRSASPSLDGQLRNKITFICSRLISAHCTIVAVSALLISDNLYFTANVSTQK